MNYLRWRWRCWRLRHYALVAYWDWDAHPDNPVLYDRWQMRKKRYESIRSLGV